ncbi:aspartate-semialdehyde dehydrogenase [Thermaurantimonas aggregans]|uniref:Aspartate-semialdehyde dehydrogenase n=1 Tax=Thermaurantimonas aggregans TaxID=2173829 RepID=A0A401XNY6_9FLAO|nr:aspartate-semialdehyde dehydrogenase [Thermaurantimonas aggregans]MCX8148618.1 aspartate-semialdehyde dehydrogenase [Thermaurantimonas aggregans]GCD78736.1 aspartate-semialdehyde dehydrogenase [Thermaurantimonas aggregans]
MKIAVVGATGLVGQVMLKVLEERNFPVTELIPVASEKNVGKTILFKNQEVKIVPLQVAVDLKPTIAIFSAGGAVSLEWAPRFAEVGCRVIDNSSAWRMDPTKKLIVPEVNGHLLTAEDMIIANPNCSTIQMVMVLAPLHKEFKAKRVVISTYQSVTGTGAKAVAQLMSERKGENAEKVYPHPIDLNCIPQCDVFLDNGYTKEEMKLTNETIKILGDPGVKVTATAVRVPVIGGHSESVNIEFEKPFEIEQIFEILSKTKGVKVLDNPQKSIYPMPIIANGNDEVYVGRVRRDFTKENSLNLWIVADNLRKGAATNAIQIAEIFV